MVQHEPVCLLTEGLSMRRTHPNTKTYQYCYFRAKVDLEGALGRNFILEYYVCTHAKSVTIDVRTLEFKFKTMNLHKNGTPLLKN